MRLWTTPSNVRHGSCSPGIYSLVEGEVFFNYAKVMSIQDLGKLKDHAMTRSDQSRNPEGCNISEGLCGRGMGQCLGERVRLG